jgi:hypothetical protein
MNMNPWLLALMFIFPFLIIGFALLCRKFLSGRRLKGACLQVISLCIAWLAGVLGFFYFEVEIAATLVMLCFLVGLFGLYMQTRRD